MTFVTRLTLFGAFGVAVALANVGALMALVEFARHDMSASHVVLIPLITAALIFESRKSIFSSVEFSWDAGLSVLILGLGLLLTARWRSGPLALSVAAVIVLWIGGFLLIFGRTAARAAFFPLFFLGFTVPIPKAVLDPVILFLKSGSAWVVDALFTVVGTPHYREGFALTLPTVTIEIADECSGIRSSIALLLTSLLAGHLSLKNWWHKVVLTAVVVPIVVLKNGIRIVSLCLLATRYDQGFLEGRLHHEGGFVFYLLGLALLAPVLALVRGLPLNETAPVAVPKCSADSADPMSGEWKRSADVLVEQPS